MVQEIVGSNMPTLASDGLKTKNKGYGQNGFAGASSDTPGQKTTSGFMPQTDITEALRQAIGGTDPKFPGDANGPMHTMRSAAVKPQPIPGGRTRTVGPNVAPAFGMSTRSPRNR